MFLKNMKFKIPKTAVSLVICVVILIPVGIAHAAYSHPLYNQWHDLIQSATYQVQSTFDSTTKTQFGEAMTTWNSQIGKNFFVKSSTETTATSPSQNYVYTITKNTYGMDGITAEHHPYSNTDGTVYESDIRFNVSYSFANSASAGKFDIKSNMIHELGHALRLGHTNVYADTMYEFITTNDDRWRTLTSADIEAAQASTARWFD